jgi:hypothetical protein
MMELNRSYLRGLLWLRPRAIFDLEPYLAQGYQKVANAVKDSAEPSPALMLGPCKKKKHIVYTSRFVWPLRKDDTHKSRSVNNRFEADDDIDIDGDVDMT